MQSKFPEMRRRFNPTPVPGLSKEAVDAVNAVLDAILAWRNATADISEKHGKQIVEKMAAAAALLGWPEQIVDTGRTQMQSMAEMQIKAMDQVIDTWEQQLKLPNPTAASSSAMLSKLKSLPGFGPIGNWPDADAFQKAAMMPLQVWLQAAAQWQKSVADTMASWGKSGKPH